MDQKELRDELVALSEEKYQKFNNIFCAIEEKSSIETGLIAGKPEMVISSQADFSEGSSTIPEMEVESSDSKCLALSIISNTDIDEGEDIVSSHINKEV